MELGLQTEIKKIALGYGLEYKISNYRVRSYLAPEFSSLQRKHPALSFRTFIKEVIRIRAEEKEKHTPSHDTYKWHGLKAYLDEISGASGVDGMPESHHSADKELLRLCAWCKKIRSENRWMTLDTYISEITGKRFSHGMCRIVRPQYQRTSPVAVT